MAEKVLTLDSSGKKKLIELTSTAENFSFHKIASGQEVKILTNQHMITTSLEIEGFLEVEGCVVML